MSKDIKVRKLDLVDITPKNNKNVVWLKNGNERILTDENFIEIKNKNKKNEK